MHPEAMAWINEHGTAKPVSVLDIGSRNINGSARTAWPNATSYTSLDIRPGDGVDIVADAGSWTPDRQYDVVVCAETFEHTDVWPAICHTMFEACKPGGEVILTMAGPGRQTHSAIDGGGHLYDGEYYGNVDPDELEARLKEVGFVQVVVDQQFSPCDVRAHARRDS